MLISQTWQDLSSEDRADCVGPPLASRRCSKFAWDIAGSLCDEWNSHIRPLIDFLVAKNYAEIHKGGGIHAAILFDLYLLSTFDDCTTAIPTILIWTADKKAGRKAKKVLQSHSLFQTVVGGLNIVVEKMAVFLAAGGIDSMTKGSDPNNGPSLCGVPVMVAAVPLGLTTSWRRATITCVVEHQDRHFMVLPAHVFYRPHDRYSAEDIEDDDDCGSDLSRSQDSGVCVDANSQSDEDHTNESHHVASSISEKDEVLQKHVVCIDYAHILENPQWEWADVAANPDSQQLVSIGYLDPKTNTSSSLGPLVCREQDFVLVEVDPGLKFWQRRNEVRSSQDGAIEVTWRSSTISASSEVVTIVSGVSGVRQATMSASASSMLFPWSIKTQRVLKVSVGLTAGDSGSAVIASDGNLVGMAVASASAAGFSYIVPVADSFGVMLSAVQHVPGVLSLDRNFRLLDEQYQGSIARIASSNNPDQASLDDSSHIHDARAIHKQRQRSTSLQRLPAPPLYLSGKEDAEVETPMSDPLLHPIALSLGSNMSDTSFKFSSLRWTDRWIDPLPPATPARSQTADSQNSKQHRIDRASTLKPEPKLIDPSGKDETMTHKAEIAQAIRQPQHGKTVFCNFCDDKPHGFHGDHELRRHIERQHMQIRKVWVCQDISEDGQFLQNCKSCRNLKTYGANYNAAAHLRRYHFNPVKNKRSRRGIFDDLVLPSTEELKAWIHEAYETTIDGRTIVQKLDPSTGTDHVPPDKGDSTTIKPIHPNTTPPGFPATSTLIDPLGPSELETGNHEMKDSFSPLSYYTYDTENNRFLTDSVS